MQRLITTPQLLEESIGEFRLRLSETSIRQAALKNLALEERMDAIQGFLAMPGPLVQIGVPQWWNLSPYLRQYAAKFPKEEGIAETIVSLRENEYYLVRIGCAFTADVEKPVKTAFFSGTFRQQLGKKEVAMIDILPASYNGQGANTDALRWSLGADMKFTPREASRTEGVLEIEFKSLLPRIETDRPEPTTAEWLFISQDNDVLLDCRYGYVLLRKPRLARNVLARQDLEVQVLTTMGLVAADIKEKDRVRLTHTICSEWIEV